MKYCTALVLALILLGSNYALAGYGSLKKEFNSYQPSIFYQENVRDREPLETADVPDLDAFKMGIEQLEQAKASWQEAVASSSSAESFFRPDPERLRRLQEIAADDEKTTAVLNEKFLLADLEILVLLRSPAIKAAQANMTAALQSISQVANLEEILKQYTAFTEALMTAVGPMKGKVPVKNSFPFPGTMALKGEIANQEVIAARAQLEIARRTVLTKTRKGYWNLLFNHKAQEISSDMVQLLKHLETVAKTRYETGKTGFQNVIQVRIKLATIEEELNTLHEKQLTLEALLKNLLNLPPNSRIGAPTAGEAPGEMPLLDPLYPIALAKRQELRKTRAMIAKMELMIEMAETMILPPLTLNLSRFEDEAVRQVGTAAQKETFPAATTAAMGAGLPKAPWFGSNDAYINRTRHSLQALRNTLAKMEAETLFMVRRAWFSLDKAKREEALYADNIVDLSQAALEVVTSGYESGKAPFADVITSYTNWLQALLKQEQSRSDLGIAYSVLEETIGASLP